MPSPMSQTLNMVVSTLLPVCYGTPLSGLIMKSTCISQADPECPVHRKLGTKFSVDWHSVVYSLRTHENQGQSNPMQLGLLNERTQNAQA